MSPGKQIAITLWFFGNQEVYRLVYIFYIFAYEKFLLQCIIRLYKRVSYCAKLLS